MLRGNVMSGIDRAMQKHGQNILGGIDQVQLGLGLWYLWGYRSVDVF